MRCLIGADPELFILHTETQKFISAHDLIPGTKDIPHGVNKGAVQVDGTSAEFNIKPADTLAEFTTNIFTVVNELTRMIKTRSDKYDLVAQPTAFFDPAYFKTLPATARALGCTPDYNAYTSTQNTVSRPRKPMRTGAGHVHVGWGYNLEPFDEVHYLMCEEFTKQLDVLLYIPSLLWDSDDSRRSMYGKIGAFRPKSYGVEYRCLSNSWVLKPELHKFIFNTVQKAKAMYDDNAFLWEAPAYADRLKQIQKGATLEREEVLDHYYDLLMHEYCEALPRSYITKD